MSTYFLTLSAAHANSPSALAPLLTTARAALSLPEPPTAIELQLGVCRFLQPWCLVSLACLLEAYHRHGARVCVRSAPLGSTLHQYLTDIGFYAYWAPGSDRTTYTPARIGTALNLWQVTPGMADFYAMEARQYFARNFLPGRSLDALAVCLVEIFNNLCDHAASPVGGYCLTQYYPRSNRLTTAVCDFGIGIPAAINRYWTAHGHAALPEADALRAALRHRVTSRSTPQNQGRGLHTLCSNAGTLRGTVQFHSTFAAYTQLPQPQPQPAERGVIWTTQDPFPGTLITLTLDTTALPEAEVEVVGADSDFEF